VLSKQFEQLIADRKKTNINLTSKVKYLIFSLVYFTFVHDHISPISLYMYRLNQKRRYDGCVCVKYIDLS
jgi:hypothetical protein